MMQCELAGDMHSSLALMLGSATVERDHHLGRLRELVCIVALTRVFLLL